MTEFYSGIPFEIEKLLWPSNNTSPDESWLALKLCFDVSVFATRWGKMVTAAEILENSQHPHPLKLQERLATS